MVGPRYQTGRRVAQFLIHLVCEAELEAGLVAIKRYGFGIDHGAGLNQVDNET